MNPGVAEPDCVYAKLEGKEDNFSAVASTVNQDNHNDDGRDTFWGRIKSDFSIVRENMKTKVVWRYYLFWVLYGLKPTFNAYEYFQKKDVYHLDQKSIGFLTTLEVTSMVVGTLMYQRFFRNIEMRTMQYWCNCIVIVNAVIMML